MLTGVYGLSWKVCQDDKKKEEYEIEEKVNPNTEPFHCS